VIARSVRWAILESRHLYGRERSALKLTPRLDYPPKTSLCA
jgi:hypothetical protein